MNRAVWPSSNSTVPFVAPATVKIKASSPVSTSVTSVRKSTVTTVSSAVVSAVGNATGASLTGLTVTPIEIGPTVFAAAVPSPVSGHRIREARRSVVVVRGRESRRVAVEQRHRAVRGAGNREDQGVVGRLDVGHQRPKIDRHRRVLVGRQSRRPSATGVSLTGVTVTLIEIGPTVFAAAAPSPVSWTEYVKLVGPPL